MYPRIKDQDIKEFSTKDSADKDVFEGAITNYYTKKPLFYPEEYREAADALLMVYFGFEQDSAL